MASAVKRIVVSQQAQFESALASEAQAAAGKGTLFVLFTGESGADGKSWCPDCNDAKPTIESVLIEASKQHGGVTLLEVPLVRQEYKGNASHWARTHAGAKLQRIPTLMRWGAKSKTGELVEGDCRNIALVRELMGVE